MSREYWDAGIGWDPLDDLINAHVGEAIKSVFEDESSWESILYFPMMWYPHDGYIGDQPPPADPLTVRFYIDGIAKRDFSLTKELLENIEQCIDDGSGKEGLTFIAERLQELATKAFAAIDARKGLDEGELQ